MENGGEAMDGIRRKLLTRLAPILGGGVAFACPLCWAGSAALLTYLGLGAIVAFWWRWIALSFLGLAVIGFAFDYRVHRNAIPLVLLILGGALLYTKSFVIGAVGLAGWQIWVPGGIAVIAAVVYNRKQFVRRKEI